jgi:hypothetical protein
MPCGLLFCRLILKVSFMKRLVILIIAILALGLASGCSSRVTDSKPMDNNEYPGDLPPGDK